MLLDWITARVCDQALGADLFLLLRSLGDRIRRYNPLTGAVAWETCAWDSVRSDSHGVTFRVGSDALWIQGSPARVEGAGCNVFGGPIAQSLNPRLCITAMAGFLLPQLLRLCLPLKPGIRTGWACYVPAQPYRLILVGRLARYGLPDARLWKVTRVDVTRNYQMESLAAVRVALSTLRNLEGGRYRVSQQAGDTIYFSHSSKMASGKVYAKGPHCDYLRKKGKQAYTVEQIEQANRLLRFELKLGCEWFRHHPEFDAGMIRERFDAFFERMLGADTVKTESEVLTALLAVEGVTEGAAKAAFGTWTMIKTQGWQWVADYLPKRTYYRHRKLLMAAGLGDIDLSAGRVVAIRREALVLRPVSSWADLAA